MLSASFASVNASTMLVGLRHEASTRSTAIAPVNKLFLLNPRCVQAWKPAH
jgi:hypothetical protein